MIDKLKVEADEFASGDESTGDSDDFKECASMDMFSFQNTVRSALAQLAFSGRLREAWHEVANCMCPRPPFRI